MSNVDLTSFSTKPIAQAEVREQPHNIEAEQGLLGAILTNNRAFEKPCITKWKNAAGAPNDPKESIINPK